MAKNVGKYAVILSADARPLAAAAQQARQLMAQVGKGAGEVARQAAGAVKSVGMVGAAATAVATAAPVAWLKRMTEGLEQADRQARKLGVSIGELRGLHLAGGAAAQEMAQAVGDLNLNLAKSAQGDLAATGLFAGVGGPGGIGGGPEGLATVLDRLQAIPSEAARAAQAFRVLGDSAAELLPFLGQGGGGVRAAQDQARRFGLMVGDNDLRTAKEVANVFREVKALWDGAQNQFALAVAPIVAELRSRLDLSGIDISGWRDAILGALEQAAMWSASIIDALGDGTAWGAIKAHAREFTAILMDGAAAILGAAPSLSGAANRELGPGGVGVLSTLKAVLSPGSLPYGVGSGGGPGQEAAAALREQARALREAAQGRPDPGSGGGGVWAAPFRLGPAQRGVLEFANSVRDRTGGNTAGPGVAGQAMSSAFLKELTQQFNQALGGVTGDDPARAFRQAMNDIGTFKQFGLFQGLPGVEGRMAFKAYQGLQNGVQLPGLQGAPGAAQYGGREAYSAVLNHERMSRQSNVQDMMKQLLEEANRQREAQIRNGERAADAAERLLEKMPEARGF